MPGQVNRFGHNKMAKAEAVKELMRAFQPAQFSDKTLH
jgi:hypothetical protein